MEKRNAYTWKCPECGTENHEDPDDLPLEDRPCKECGEEFTVEADDSRTWQAEKRRRRNQ